MSHFIESVILVIVIWGALFKNGIEFGAWLDEREKERVRKNYEYLFGDIDQ